MKGSFLIALSGYAQPEDLQRSADAGFDRHVAKPPRLDRLEQLLRQAPALATQAIGASGHVEPVLSENSSTERMESIDPEFRRS